MPTYALGEYQAEIARGAVLLDTNLLFARFTRDDARADEASYFFEFAGPLLVPLCVIGEAWGLMVGKHKQRDSGIEMLRWVATPGSATIIRDDEELARQSEALVARYDVDFVDAMLMLLADRLSRQCLGTPIPIATLDIRDFSILRRAKTHTFQVYDVASGDTW